MSFQRSNRVSGLVRQVVGEALMFKVKNQQAKKATVQRVEVSPNLRHVKIFVSTASEEKEATMQALESASGFIRREIGSQVKLKFTPEIKFIYDNSLDNAEKIEQLLKGVLNKAN